MPDFSLEALAQQPATDIRVQLFTLNATNLGLGTYYFTPGDFNSQEGVYQGVTYTPYPVQISGYEVTSQGTQPRPKLAISNYGGFIGGLVIAGGDLLGATISRIVTFARFLDNGATPDPDAFWGPQTLIIDRKSMHTKTVIEWELATPLDHQNLKLPSRLALKDTCLWTYRSWDGREFDYYNVICPYTGNAYFNVQGQSQSDPANDQCGKRLSDCKLRFGSNNPLPFGGFPGMQQV